MNENDFEKLLKERENKDLDFKLDLPKPDKIARLVVAFYNSRGGKIVFGVKDETREPVGLKDPQRTEERFTQSIRQYCRLDEEPEIEFVNYKNKEFIVAHCPKGKDTPYFVKGEHTPRVRIGSSNMPANREEIARLYREGSSKSQDVYPIENADLDDIDPDKIKEYFRESELTEQLDENHFYTLLKKENFVACENKKLVPTTAGILLFGKHPSINMSNVVMKVDRYKGNTITEWIDKQDLDGTIFEQIEGCIRFFKRNMRISAWSAETHTEHKTEYPIDALKEAVINALVHRDWNERKNILVRMFDDRVEVMSPGELLRPLTVETLRKHEYQPESRNKTITKVLARRGIMDERGTGILRIEQLMGEWGLEKPTYCEKDGWFVITFKGSESPVLEIPDKILIGLNKRQRKIIGYLRENKRINRSICMRVLEVSKNTAVRELSNLMEKNVIKREGIGRGIYYMLK